MRERLVSAASKSRQTIVPVRIPVLFALAVVLLDQVTKFALIDLMASRGFVPLDILPVFSLVMVWNTGVSFGLFAGHPDETRWVLMAVNLVVAVALFVWLRRMQPGIVRLALAGVAGGAVGNAIDRAVHGAVADFFDFHVGTWAWPAFNVADIAISLGVVVLLLDSLFGGGKAAK